MLHLCCFDYFLAYLKSQYYFTFLACFCCIYFFTFCFAPATYKIFCLKIKYFAQFYFISPLHLLINFIYMYFASFCIFSHLLIQHGDIVRNPGPQSSKSKNLLCFDCNVNSLVARNLAEISQFEVCNNSPYKHDFICL